MNELREGKLIGRSAIVLRWALFLVVAAYLLFAHGCHGNEDTDLFEWIRAAGL